MGSKPTPKRLSILFEISSLSSIIMQFFYFVSITTLSLLLPLSFLLLARLSAANFIFSASNQKPDGSFLFSVFLYTNPTLLHALVAVITLSSLIHALTGRITLLLEQPVRPRLHIAWVLLCTLQVCVGLGAEASIETGLDGYGSGWPTRGNNLYSKVVFFVGVHETMMHWWRTVVKPVVDDAMWGGARAERWAERAAMAAGCGALWWLRLREEVGALVAVVEMKMETVAGGVGVGDFVGWWLYYVIVTIGVARIVKGVLWVGIVMFFRRFEEGGNGGNESLEVVAMADDQV